VAYQPSGGSVTSVVNLNNGKYQATYTTGTIPAVNTITATGVADVSVPMVLYSNSIKSGSFNLPAFVRGTGTLQEQPIPLTVYNYGSSQFTCDPNTGCKLRDTTMTFQSGQQAVFFDIDDPQYHYIIGQPRYTTYTVFGVNIIQKPGTVFINSNGISVNDLQTKYTISPPEYQAVTADVILSKDSSPFVFIPGDINANGSATLAKGTMFSTANTYESQVVLNYGSAAEISSNEMIIGLASINLEIRDKNNPCNKTPGKLDGMLIISTNKNHQA
jgi:hypothetical protein